MHVCVCVLSPIFIADNTRPLDKLISEIKRWFDGSLTWQVVDFEEVGRM